MHQARPAHSYSKTKPSKARSKVAERAPPSSGEMAYAALLGLKFFDLATFQQALQRGIPIAGLRLLQQKFVLSLEEMAEALQISPRTLSRRKEAGRLDALESDRALRFSRVYSKALDLYEGNDEAALSWLKRKDRALEGLSPLDLIRTEAGAILVEQLIGRLEYGVYS